MEATSPPRIGDEVLVECLDGDPDRPLVIGSVYNPQDIPPYSAGEDSPVNHAGTVSGLHSRGVDGTGFELKTDSWGCGCPISGLVWGGAWPAIR